MMWYGLPTIMNEVRKRIGKKPDEMGRITIPFHGNQTMF